MKDKAKTEKETTTKKAKKPVDPIKFLQDKLEYFEEHWGRIDEVEDRMREFTECCSTILTRLTDQGLIISEFRKNSTMLLEVTDFNRKELDHLRRSTLEFVKHVGNIEENIKDRCEVISNSQGAQYSLIGHRIDRLYQELQLLTDAKGLDLDMKKIVDGLEQTVHDTSLSCKRRYDEVKDGIWHHMFVIRNEIEDIKKTRKLTEWLLVWGFTMALVAFAFTIVNVIKQAFF